jgi:predicted dehydrogenase
MHAEQSILAMSHGKHVLCEKPLASNAREAKEMIAASEQYGVALMEAMKSTLSPNFRAVKENLHRIGTPRRYFASFCQYSSRYDKYKEGVVLNAFRPELSNGAMMDIGVYTIYPLVALFGKPQSISAQGILLSSGADGQGAVNMQYDGLNATVLYSKIANSQLPAEIQGEEGNILIDRIQTPVDVRFYPRQAPASGHEKRVEGELLSREESHNEYYYEIQEFIDMILSGRRESEINSHATSLATMEIIDEVRRQIGVHYPADDK